LYREKRQLRVAGDLAHPRVDSSGRRRRISLRLIVNACLYLLRTGCPWRLLPKEYPKWQSVYYHFAMWRRDHT
jgi:putative transposase